MPNKYYRRGYKYERKCVEELKDIGYFSIRSGGSKKIDVVAFLQRGFYLADDPCEGHNGVPLVRAIMVTCSDTPAKRKKDTKYLLSMRLPTIVSLELWIYSKGTREIVNVKHEK